MKLFTQFPYVDAFWKIREDKATKWVRILSKDVQKKIRIPSNNQNCFCSIQKFSDSVRTDEMQIHYCSLYFDLDADPANYESPEFALETAKKEAIKIIDTFLHLGVEETHIRVWYSGYKGFHIAVNPEALGIKPSVHLTYMMDLAALQLEASLSLKTLDTSVYSKVRQWRLPNSIHQSSGRFKIELYHHELRKFGYKEICELAKGARQPLYDQTEYEEIKASDDAVIWWNRFVEAYDHKEKMRRLEPTEKVIKTKKWPLCIQDLMTNGVKGPARRNRTTMCLASYFKDIGVPEAECEKILLKWLDEKVPKIPEKTLGRISNTKAVTKNIYRTKEQHFSCAYVRSVGTDTNKVACNHPCEAIKNDPETQRPINVPRVPLSRASEAVYLAKKVSIPVMITGKADSPYAYPKKVRFRCTPNLETQLCQSCSLSSKPSSEYTEIEFDMRNQTLIDLINCADSRRNGVIRRYVGIPSRCCANSLEIVEQGNLEEVRLQPNVLSGLQDSRRGSNGVNLDPIDEGDYCTRLAYFVGHNIAINKKYDILAYVWGHPRDQKICHIFDEAQASQDDIDKFVMTKDIYSMLRGFQPIEGQSIENKFNDIHDDLENNVHMIWGRREVAIAVDLIYHSVIGFSFQGVYERKGWMELLIIGDSGNGKTKLVERVMSHYQLGEITGVEGGKRTGLIWANHNIGGRFMLTWGKIPQNDRRLIVLDEFSGMPDEEVAQMTRLRTEGIAESQGINPAQTTARTRMIFLSNARNGKPLDSYNYGVVAIDKLFKEHQDVRRLDLAVCVKSGDIPLEVINKKHIPDPNTHNYHTDMCKKLILWAWSRDPKQIKFLPETEELILKDAIRLGRKYRCDIALVEPSDQRLKIARTACAVAARMFSTDSAGELLIIKPEHVEFATAFIQRCYDHRAMDYATYAKTKQERMFIDNKKTHMLKQYFLKLKHQEHIRKVLLEGHYFRKGDMQDQFRFSKEEMAEFLAVMSEHFLLVSTTSGYKKSPMFTEFLKNFDRIGNTDPPQWELQNEDL